MYKRQALQFEAAKSASVWANCKDRAINDLDNTDDEEEEQGQGPNDLHRTVEQRMEDRIVANKGNLDITKRLSDQRSDGNKH